MKFSLIVSTLNRPIQLSQCITSLLNQDYKNFEIIVIDQSDDDISQVFLESVKSNCIKIKYCRVNYKALSRARNDAIVMAEGDYICLMDDDAIYDTRYLQTAYEYLIQDFKKVILSGIIFGKESGEEYVKYKIAKDEEKLKYWKILTIGLSAGLIIPVDFLRIAGGFDEDFGIGAQFGSGEETDLLIRAKECGYKIIHLKKLILFHPMSSPAYDYDFYNKTLNYAMGAGAIIKKHMIYNHNYKLFSKLLKLTIGPCIKILISRNNDIRKNYYMKLIGFYRGFRRYKSRK